MLTVGGAAPRTFARAAKTLAPPLRLLHQNAVSEAETPCLHSLLFYFCFLIFKGGQL